MSDPSDSLDCEIHLRGHLDERWSGSFPGLTLTHGVDAGGAPLTILRGPVLDEAALHGVLARVRDLGIPLLAVRRAVEGGACGHSSGATEPAEPA